jgi:hypothetical protein
MSFEIAHDVFQLFLEVAGGNEGYCATAQTETARLKPRVLQFTVLHKNAVPETCMETPSPAVRSSYHADSSHESASVT